MVKLLWKLMVGMAISVCGICMPEMNAYALGCTDDGNGQLKEAQDEIVRDCHPLFEAGKTWRFRVTGLSHSDKAEILEFYAVKERVFRYGKDCWHITKTVDDSQQVVMNYYCYENDGRVFWYDDGFGGWALILDFNLSQGDNVLKSNRYVHAKDKICVGGIDRNRPLAVK